MQGTTDVTLPLRGRVIGLMLVQETEKFVSLHMHIRQSLEGPFSGESVGNWEL